MTHAGWEGIWVNMMIRAKPLQSNGVELIEMAHNRGKCLMLRSESFMNCDERAKKQSGSCVLKKRKATGAKTLVTTCH